MVSERMKKLISSNSTIREMFEEGKRLASIYGKENVFDFSLGNPSIPTPKKVTESIIDIVQNEDSLKVHGYTGNAGIDEVRETVSNSINKKFGTNFTKNNIIMVVGAASGLNIIFKSILDSGDEVITFAPYFMEYNHYVSSYGGTLISIAPDVTTFQPNLEEFEKSINPKTKAVLINTPNNPSGVIYSAETLKKIANILEEKQKEFGHEIFLVSDEPYRELAYDNTEVPYVTKFYKNTFVVYSYSKSLSLPGERIGYVVVSNKMEDCENIVTALTISNRIIGSVNAPSLMQLVIMRCIDEKVDLETYDTNRNLLYNALIDFGFECIKPQGAFYLFMKTPIEDDVEFCKKAKEFNLIFVPGSSFACPGYVRICYCVDTDMIKRSFASFKKLAEVYF